MTQINGSSKVVERTHHIQEVTGSNRTSLPTFSFLTILIGVSLMKVPHGGATLLIYLKMCLAVQLDVKTSLLRNWQKLQSTTI